MTDEVQGIGHPSKEGKGRRSCLFTFLILSGLVVVLGGGLAVLLFFWQDVGDFSFSPGLGLIEVDGIITESDPIVEALVKLRRDREVKAIILRIDSPGGGVAVTQEIYRELIRTKKEKKIIASLGSMAASGGLYLAVSADRVVANPATLTGSIGVILNLVNLEGLLGKIGLTHIAIKSGKFKDVGSSSRPMTDEERAILQHVVDDMYQQFVTDVAKSRGLDVEKVRGLADGRVFTGEEALKLGLVDQLGNFEDAVEWAKKEAGLEGRPRFIRPQKKESWLRELLRSQGVLGLWPSRLRQTIICQYLYLPGL